MTFENQATVVKKTLCPQSYLMHYKDGNKRIIIELSLMCHSLLCKLLMFALYSVYWYSWVILNYMNALSMVSLHFSISV